MVAAAIFGKNIGKFGLAGEKDVSKVSAIFIILVGIIFDSYFFIFDEIFQIIGGIIVVGFTSIGRV